ncbi:hypothetical protein [Azospirillum endophyticum]
MPVTLHSACIERLRESLKKALSMIIVDKNQLIRRHSTVGLFESEKILPSSGKSKNIKGDLEEYIGEYPVFDFVYETISKELSENQTYDSEVLNLKLTSIECYKDVEALANRLLEQFITLPWSYKFSLNISSELISPNDFLEDTVDFGGGVSLSKVTDEFKERFPLESHIEARNNNLSKAYGPLLLKDTLNWNSKGVVLQVERLGFVGHYGKTSPVISAEETIKSFFGLGLALFIFKHSKAYYPIPPKRHLYVHRLEDDRWCIDSKNDLDDDFSEAIMQITFDNLEGRIKDNKKIDWLIYHFNQIRSCFASAERAEPILLACRWLFDSYAGRNELLSYVQATVALEILLGDKASSDLMGLSELLRNRCAYLIGTTNTERQSILDDFKGIYEIRCKIVHRGKSHLSFGEKAMFNKLRKMCARVIQKEVDLLLKESENI